MTTAVEGPARSTARVPAWAAVSSLALALAGLAVSVYLTVEHFTAGRTLACPESATVNCVKVTTSRYSQVLGVPVAVLGVVFFVVAVLLCLPRVWRAGGAALRRLRLAVTAVGVVSVLYLVWAELFGVDAICLWCTAVHLITLALFAVVAIGTALATTDDLA